MTDEHRTKIANSQILKVLIEHVEGKREMSATQVSAGVALLRKVMPDLTSVEMKATIESRTAKEMSDDELFAIAAGSRERTAEAEAGAPEPDRIH